MIENGQEINEDELRVYCTKFEKECEDVKKSQCDVVYPSECKYAIIQHKKVISND